MMINWGDISKGCVKVLLLVLNSLCILVAMCTFAFAVVDIRILKQYGEQTGGTYIANLIIIAASLLLIMIASFGCVGVLKNSVKILYLYVGFLMILVVLEFLIGIYVSVQRYGLEFRVTEYLREDFFRNNTDDVHKELWDELQLTYECCGLNGPDDYPAVRRPISMSCCPRAYRARTEYAQEQLYKNCLLSESYNSEGCEDEILYVLRSDGDWLLGIAVLSFWFEAAGMLLAMWMANNLKNSVHVYKYPPTPLRF